MWISYLMNDIYEGYWNFKVRQYITKYLKIYNFLLKVIYYKLSTKIVYNIIKTVDNI